MPCCKQEHKELELLLYFSVLNNCDSDPCQNGGKCTDLYLDFSCACLVGFTGKNCEIDLDDCQDHVCNNNGTCVDGANTYTCECGDGYNGDFCEIQVGMCFCEL